MESLSIIRPDDWHIHLRDGDFLRRTVADVAAHFARAMVMPNLDPPISDVAQALAYRERILAAAPDGVDFEPLMTLYLRADTSAEELRRAADSRAVIAVKWYPAGATTGSAAGVRSARDVYATLEIMEKLDVPLSVHAELPDPDIDVFDRERAFLERELTPVMERFPALRIVVEHISTRDGAQFARAGGGRVAATITAHHLRYNRNHLLGDGLRPHHYCMPVPKRETHRQALVAAATGGEPQFFLGTDSAPHLRADKESACGCAGCYTAPLALAMCAEIFDAAGALERFEGFVARHGAAFYGLAPNSGSIRLRRRPWRVPRRLSTGIGGALIPLAAGETLSWQVG